MSRERGKKFEQLAETYLINKGFAILENNWRWKHWEIDLIAEKDGWIIFVEVKGRKNTLFGYPYEFIDAKKEQALVQAAHAYIEQNNISANVRFDAISITETKHNHYVIEHIENIFTL